MSLGGPALLAGHTGDLPIIFEENRGQTAAEVRFVARAPRQTLFLTPDAITTRIEPHMGVLRMEPVRANRAVAMSGESPTGASSHYLGPGTAVHARQFGRVRYRGVYDGIDLVVYARESKLEYDVVVAPHADPRVVRFRFRGHDALSVAPNGDLVIATPAGEVRQEKPVAYQMIGGRRRAVAARYALAGDEVRFAVGTWDRGHQLVIDPTIVFRSTFSGSNALDGAYDVAADAAGNSYIAGTAASLDFRTTAGTLFPASGGGGVFKSIDGGATWSAANAGLAINTACGSPNFANVTALVVSKTTPTTLYAGFSSQHGVYKTTDGGQTWAPVTRASPTSTASPPSRSVRPRLPRS